MTSKRGSLGALVALLLLIGACADEPFSDLGHVDQWVDAVTTERPHRATTTTLDEMTPRPIDDVFWYNGWAPVVGSEPDEVIDSVWASTDQVDVFVQSPPNLIAAALPGVKVPEMVPAKVSHITSQLVYGRSSGRLTNFYVAAFGFWSAEPYSVSRQVGQLAKLEVAIDEDPPTDPADPSEGCSRFIERNFVSCDPADLDGREAWWLGGLDGQTLIWLDAPYRYELTRRSRLEAESVESMAASTKPLAELVPSEETLAVAREGARLGG